MGTPRTPTGGMQSRIHLRKDFDIIAVDLSGCGDSDHRAQYNYGIYTRANDGM